ncbi:ubiquitin activating enzyme E1 [Pelomyxa schiedti]|nr:ubiquitin activating enzyme E1 [Pelomyxa schiedti]
MTTESGSSAMQIDDALYNRQRYVLGDNAMKKMSVSDVFISGLSGLGVEIAKNVALAGVRSITLHDTVLTSLHDLSTQFFLSEKTLGQNRAAASVHQLAELNPYVKMLTDRLGEPLDTLPLSYFEKYTVVVLLDCPLATQLKIDAHCRAHGIGFISTSVRGVVSQCFVDLGTSFAVNDKDGEMCKEFFVGSITPGNPTVVTCLPYERHDLETGDLVQFKEIVGLTKLNSEVHRITVINPNSFSIPVDTTGLTYTSGGMVTQVKDTVMVSFSDLATSMDNPRLTMFDTAKFDAPAIFHVAFMALEQFAAAHGGQLPRPWNRDDATEVMTLATAFNSRTHLVPTLPENMISQVSFTAIGQFQPITAFMGGVVAQEVIKAVTGKFTPLNQWLYADFLEVLPPLDTDPSLCVPINNFYDAQRVCIGQKSIDLLLHSKSFMVGAGAIGCEMLKNMAMMGMGAGDGGHVTITDPDLIEKSNLNRQFLFRPGDIQKPKSTCAALSVKKMNPALHVASALDKMEPASENKYSDTFFQSLDVVINALDNVAARLYMDSRCVANERPLLESGTLGSKGHVQVIVPHLTESYASQHDPAEKDVPLCTIHSFPNNMDHCIQWARDKFEKLFVTSAKDIKNALEDPLFLEKTRNAGLAQYAIVKRISKALSHKPTCMEHCIAMARIKFQSFFFNIVKHLLAAFPLDMKLKDGTLFWTNPKRPPTPIAFDPTNPTHITYIRSAAHIYANVFNVTVTPMPDDFIAQVSASVALPEFRYKSGKKIVTEKDDSPSAATPAPETSSLPNEQEWEVMLTQLSTAITANRGSVINPQTFEKDVDENGHVDFIWAVANVRAQSYNIAPSDRITTKRIAGKIVPAIATTTAAVSGLVMGEIVKVLNRMPLGAYRNAFMNLAIPCFALSEPGEAKKTKITGTLSTTIWDSWAVKKGDITLKEFCDHFKEKFKLTVTGVVQKARMIYVYMPGAPLPMYQRRLTQKMSALLQREPNQGYVDLVVTFADENNADVNGPAVRFHF